MKPGALELGRRDVSRNVHRRSKRQNNARKRFRQHRSIPAAQPPARVGRHADRQHWRPGIASEEQDAFLSDARRPLRAVGNETCSMSSPNVRNQLLQCGAPSFTRRTPKASAPEMLQNTCSPFTVATATHHEQTVAISIIIDHCRKSEMPGSTDDRSAATQGSLFIFPAKDGKSTSSMMQPKQSRDERRQEWKMIRVKATVRDSVAIHFFLSQSDRQRR